MYLVDSTRPQLPRGVSVPIDHCPLDLANGIHDDGAVSFSVDIVLVSHLTCPSMLYCCLPGFLRHPRT